MNIIPSVYKYSRLFLFEHATHLERLQNIVNQHNLNCIPQNKCKGLFADSKTHKCEANCEKQSFVDKNKLFDTIDSLFGADNNSNKLAYKMLQDNINQEYSKDTEYLWRFAKATSLIASDQHNKEVKKDLAFKAVQIATTALNSDQNNPNCHKWFAVATGLCTDYQSINGKILNGITYKKHLEKAIELNPSDPESYFYIGRMYYEISMLNCIERKLVATVFESPNAISVEDALSHFHKAQKLEKSGEGKHNMLFIAKCHIQNSQYSEAASWLTKAKDVPSTSYCDRLSQPEIDSLLHKYGSYLK